MKETIFKSTDKLIIDSLVQMINSTVEKQDNSFDISEFFLAMHRRRKQIVDDSGMKRDVKLILNSDVFLFQVAKAVVKSNLKLSKDNRGVQVADFIHKGVLYNGLHPCPDVSYYKVQRYVNTLP